MSLQLQMHQLDSLSAALMYGVTLYRNQAQYVVFGGETNYDTIKLAIAQVGYALIGVVAVVESAVALTFTVLEGLFRLVVKDIMPNRCPSWLQSSTFCIGWSVIDFFLNLPVRIAFPADERSAREMFRSGSLIECPKNAALYAIANP